jgi:hypothetical protein
MKFVFTLRDPAERVYSSYTYTVQHEGLDIPFKDLIYPADIDKIQSYIDIKSSFYYTNISRFLEYFPKEQMLFIIFEDFRENPDRELKKICKFLGVDDSFKFDPTKFNRNASVVPLSLKLQKLIFKIDSSRKRYDDTLLRFITFTGLKMIGNKIHHSISRKKFPKMDPELRKYLYDEYFEEEVKNLEKLLGREIKWRKNT